MRLPIQEALSRLPVLSAKQFSFFPTKWQRLEHPPQPCVPYPEPPPIPTTPASTFTFHLTLEHRGEEGSSLMKDSLLLFARQIRKILSRIGPYYTVYRAWFDCFNQYYFSEPVKCYDNNSTKRYSCSLLLSKSYINTRFYSLIYLHSIQILDWSVAFLAYIKITRKLKT